MSTNSIQRCLAGRNGREYRAAGRVLTSVRLVGMFCLLLAPALIGRGAPQTFSSGENRTHLIELFSSEGCSSCPPAEAWLNGLRDESALWRDFVPVAFHVDYWDRLGWIDRLATREFTARQYAYADQWGANTVYTPGFVLDGHDWRERSGRKPPRSGDMAGILKVELSAGRARVTFQPAVPAKEAFEVHLALLGGGIISPVKAGENRGETLQHEFVALYLVTQPLASGVTEFNLPKAPAAGVKRRALAAWVTRRQSREPLQATGGWLD